MLSIAAFSSMPTMDVRKDRCRPPTCTMGVVMVVRSSVWARSTPAAGTMMIPSTLRATSDSMRSSCVCCSLPMPSSSCCLSMSMTGSSSSSSPALKWSVAEGMTSPMVLVAAPRSELAA